MKNLIPDLRKDDTLKFIEHTPTRKGNVRGIQKTLILRRPHNKIK